MSWIVPLLRARPLLLAVLLLHLQIGGCATSNGALSVPLSRNVETGDTFMGVRLLGTLRLPDDPVDGFALGGISALAWDQDDEVLYALSDQGWLFHLRPVIADGLLTDVRRLHAYPLRDLRGEALHNPWHDAEGLTLRNGANGIAGDAELWVSFEARPRVRRYTPEGRRLGGVGLPPALQNTHRFAHNNTSLEAITLHPRYGMLLAPEKPLRDGPSTEIGIRDSDGRVWRYPLSPARGSALVALEALADGSLLTLERAFVSLTQPLVISLRRTRLDAPDGGLLPVEDVAVFDTSKGWLLDNFEGLTQHRYNRFFMISDDNTSFLQSTLLVYFEVLARP